MSLTASTRERPASAVDLSIIIVNWRSCQYLRECLASIRGGTEGIEYEVIVVDNASFDGAETLIAREFPTVKYLQLQQNLGFARANNFAARVARGQTLLFLNPDTRVIGQGMQTLYRHFQDLPDAGAAGCKLLNADGTIQSSCIQSTPTLLNQFFNAELARRCFPRSKLWGMQALYAGTDAPQTVEMVSGACLMVKRSAFEAAGGFSTDYFMYAEDLDLCYHLRQAGYKIYFVPASTIVHHGGVSSGQAGSHFSAVVMAESVWRFLRKTRGFSYGVAYRASLILAGVVRVVCLSLAMPLLLAVKGFRSWRRSVLKWLAILCWGVGLRPPALAGRGKGPAEKKEGSLSP